MAISVGYEEFADAVQMLDGLKYPIERSAKQVAALGA
jgi:hypothetical protein